VESHYYAPIELRIRNWHFEFEMIPRHTDSRDILGSFSRWNAASSPTLQNETTGTPKIRSFSRYSRIFASAARVARSLQ
jgi:hypothetical protein